MSLILLIVPVVLPLGTLFPGPAADPGATTQVADWASSS
jgi:hypothetical protein